MRETRINTSSPFEHFKRSIRMSSDRSKMTNSDECTIDKIIKVCIENRMYEIYIPSLATCGWLLSQCQLLFKKLFGKKCRKYRLIALKSKSGIDTIDYYLTIPER